MRRSPLSTIRRALACTLTALVAVPVSVLYGAAPAAADTSQFRGVNWAHVGDNFVNGPLVLEGLNVSDNYTTVRAKSSAIYTGFQSIGVNTVRLPVNTPTVDSTWWNSYSATIDAATAKGLKVVLGYWEEQTHDGKIDDPAAWNAMWDTIVAKYSSNSLVYFEPMNEPYGYSDTAWADIAATWIADRPEAPKNRIFVSGAGYNQRLETVCDDPRLNGTYISYHHYAFMYPAKTYDEWVAHFRDQVGSCAPRTVLDEFGSPMDDEPDTGFDYNDPDSGHNFVRFLRADTDTLRSLGMGSIYWPALGGKHQERPTYDYYSLFALHGSGTGLTLSIRNTTGIDRLKYAWGIGNGSGTSNLRNADGDTCLDVPGATHTPTQVQASTCSTSDAQQWTRTGTGQITVYDGAERKCLDAYGHGTANGTVVGTYSCNDQDNQKWTFYSDGTIRGVESGRCLDVNRSDGSKVILYECWGGSNQKWQLA
ncbi:ricin-type beta-trefoil lectin domain protein [Streptomyces sp. T-3]|nr:ricin-type beta-trefoil lectin domain protein [Streptomyces sp. T-3]